MPLQPKKSRILASTSRQGNRQSRVQVERSEDEDATSETADTVESGTGDQSQELGTSPAKRSGQIGQIMENVLDQQHRIRDARKQKVLESYDNAYTTAQSSIGALFNDHEKQS
jgi:carbamate kinase